MRPIGRLDDAEYVAYSCLTKDLGNVCNVSADSAARPKSSISDPVSAGMWAEKKPMTEVHGLESGETSFKRGDAFQSPVA
jgi:hypothetical protein